MHPNTPQVVPGQVQIDQSVVPEKTYYACLDGACYYFANGKTARFENGVYSTQILGEQEELDKMVGTDEVKEVKEPGPNGKVLIPHQPARQPTAGNHMYFRHEVPVQRTDAHVLKDVSKASGTGVVNSANLAGLTRK